MSRKTNPSNNKTSEGGRKIHLLRRFFDKGCGSAYFVAHGGYRRPAEPATLACDGSARSRKTSTRGPLLPKNLPGGSSALYRVPVEAYRLPAQNVAAVSSIKFERGSAAAFAVSGGGSGVA